MSVQSRKPQAANVVFEGILKTVKELSVTFAHEQLDQLRKIGEIVSSMSSQEKLLVAHLAGAVAVAGATIIMRKSFHQEASTTTRDVPARIASRSGDVTTLAHVVLQTTESVQLEQTPKKSSMSKSPSQGSTAPQQSKASPSSVVSFSPTPREPIEAACEVCFVPSTARGDKPESHIEDRDLLHILPPSRGTPHVGLFESNATLACAKQEIAHEMRPSESRSDNDPCDPGRVAAHRKKLLQVNELLTRVGDCMEKEKLRASKLCLKTDKPLGQWVDEVRSFESSTNSLTLRKLIGAERSSVLASYLVENLVVVPSQGIPQAKRDSEERSPDPAVPAENSVAELSIFEQLGAFSCFLFARELLEAQKGPTARVLLFRTLSLLYPPSHHALQPGVNIFTQPSGLQISQRGLVSFPVGQDHVFYEALLWYFVGELLELQDGDVDMLAALPEVSLPSVLIAASKELNHSLPLFAVAYLMCLQLSNGNYGPAWHALALCLEKDDSIVVLGRKVSALQCLGESVRCQLGFQHCTNGQLWSDAASVLEIANGPLSAGSNSFRFDAPCSAHEDFLTKYPARRVACDRKMCLSKFVSLPEGASDGNAWTQLGLLLSLGSVTEVVNGVPRHVLKEESIDVAGMNVTRYDCFSLALAIDPCDSNTWYRAALGMEDKARHQSQPAIATDRNVYERPLLGGGGGHIDRVTALTYALSFSPEDPKLWFALATTAFERNNDMTQPSKLQISLPKKLFGSFAQSACLATPSGEGVEPHSRMESIGDDLPEVLSVSAETLFNKCISLRLSMESVVHSWLERRRLSSATH